MISGREKELRQLNAELSSWKRRTAVLVYGKCRVGKSTLLSEAAKRFEGVVINHMCVTSSFEGNMELIYRSVSEGLGLPNIRFGDLFEIMDHLKTLDKKILLIIDEYPYLKQTKKKNEVDSYMQAVIDRLPENVKLVLCGSYITVMKELLDMEIIQKTDPINRRNDKKKQFYEIVDNLMRFYFTFIFDKAGTIARIG
ncbi:ATP-binding protein [Ruminococcus sp.]|uniref:AAA family ATPase n=1 Tax=Ruminococcus sp. TaxID=41978 RepID=UPI00338DE2E7